MSNEIQGFHRGMYNNQGMSDGRMDYYTIKRIIDGTRNLFPSSSFPLPSSPQVVGGDRSFFIIIPFALKQTAIFRFPLPIPGPAHSHKS